MKVFLISTPAAQENYGDLFKKLYTEIEHLGYTHTSNYINTSSEQFQVMMDQGKDAHSQFYDEMTSFIRASDICIFEASTASFGVGYLIQYALAHAKPTIVLFYKEIKSYLISGVDDEKLTVATYNEKNYKKVLKEEIDKARERRDKRFNFFISPKLLEYLETTSTQEGVTKSKFIRNLIVKRMRAKPTEEL